jgi:inosine-uridine nucleoside N-ribohydrolase
MDPADRHQQRRPELILDCDPGHDDALALVLATSQARVLGVTTVAGNAPLERTTANACALRDVLGSDVEVHAGASRPLLREPMTASHVHGATGLDGADLPPPIRPADSHDAVAFLIDTCRAHEGVSIVATGPLTNLALALRGAPDLAARIDRVSVMGGGSFGNRTPVAEFNLWADPEAASIVFAASPFGGGPLVMAGLDVTFQFVATPDRIERIEALGGPLATALAGCLRFYARAYAEQAEPGSLDGAPMHDPLAVIALTHPWLFERELRHVAVETGGVLTRGMTVIDRRRVVRRPAPNTEVLTAVDAAGAFEVLVSSVTGDDGGSRTASDDTAR